MKARLSTALSLALLSGVLASQELIVIKAGRVLTMSKGTLEAAVIVIENGRIKEIGTDVKAEWNAKVIDASDKVVMPTWVVGHTYGGMNTANERMPNVPYLTVQDAVDPAADFFEEALRNGIGTLHVTPGNSTLIGGLGMVVRPAGRTIEDMAVRMTGAMKLSLDGGGQSRMAQIQKLRRALTEAQDYQKDYDRQKAEFELEKAAGATGDRQEFDEPLDPKKKPLLDLLAAKHRAFLFVPSAAEVPEALRISSGYAFETVLVLGPSCYKAAAHLAGLQRPVVLSEALEFWETDPDTEQERLVCPAAELFRRGIPFALSIDHGGRGGAGRYPWWQIATVIRHGVDRQIALEAMTIVPARLLGLERELGSIEVGKVANLQILTGDPLQATTWVDTVLLEGKVAYERAKDPRLQHLFSTTTEPASSNGR